MNKKQIRKNFLSKRQNLSKNDKKSLSFSVVFGANDRTLEEDEVSMIIKELLSNLKKEADAEIRE